MSSSRALCCLPSVKKQKHDLNFFSAQCIIKQLLDSVFVISRIIEVSVRVIPYLDLDYHKNHIIVYNLLTG